MIYMIFALKAEAQAFIDKKLDVNIIISGIGSQNMYNATKKTLKLMNEDDIIVNVGICGASKKFHIGELLDISMPSQRVKEKFTLTCVNNEVQNKDKYEIVDMESLGFIDATNMIKNRYMFKIVSDHFEPKKVTKDGTKKLIFDKANEIMRRIKK
ncbi:MAG: hypothetical protein L3I99_06570 [Sulfurimonas sp.]|nr:hypothetical protein [Sulfurimonas sp.]